MATEVSPDTPPPRSLALRKSPKGANVSVLGLIPQPGEWFVAYSVVRMGCKADSPTIAGVCAISDLDGRPRTRADNWIDQLSVLTGASAPAN